MKKQNFRVGYFIVNTAAWNPVIWPVKSILDKVIQQWLIQLNFGRFDTGHMSNSLVRHFKWCKILSTSNSNFQTCLFVEGLSATSEKLSFSLENLPIKRTLPTRDVLKVTDKRSNINDRGTSKNKWHFWRMSLISRWR